MRNMIFYDFSIAYLSVLWYGMHIGVTGMRVYRGQIRIQIHTRTKDEIHHNEHEDGDGQSIFLDSKTGLLWRTRHGCIVDILVINHWISVSATTKARA